MSSANGRNFRARLRLIVFGVGSGESADRRLDLRFVPVVCRIENLSAISWPQKPIGGDD